MRNLFYGIIIAASCAMAFCNPATLPLPAGSELILRSPYSSSFSCDGRSYGFYADLTNNCQVFHVCVPVDDNAGGVKETLQYSFLCGNQTAFNQEFLTCDYIKEVNCENAENYYYKNDDFGVTPAGR